MDNSELTQQTTEQAIDAFQSAKDIIKTPSISIIERIANEACQYREDPLITDVQSFCEYYLDESGKLGFLNFIKTLTSKELENLRDVFLAMNTDVVVDTLLVTSRRKAVYDFLEVTIDLSTPVIFGFRVYPNMESFIRFYSQSRVSVDFTLDELVDYIVETL